MAHQRSPEAVLALEACSSHRQRTDSLPPELGWMSVIDGAQHGYGEHLTQLPESSPVLRIPEGVQQPLVQCLVGPPAPEGAGGMVDTLVVPGQARLLEQAVDVLRRR
jgi:hypothetical protein